jgi:hypothetical protein
MSTFLLNREIPASLKHLCHQVLSARKQSRSACPSKGDHIVVGLAMNGDLCGMDQSSEPWLLRESLKHCFNNTLTNPIKQNLLPKKYVENSLMDFWLLQGFRFLMGDAGYNWDI